MTDQADHSECRDGNRSGRVIAEASVFFEAQRLFERASELPNPKRAAFLSEQAMTPELATLVAGLLRSDEKLSASESDADPLRSIAPDFAAAAIGLLEGDLHTGERVGPYEVVRTLGEGGFGVVYLGIRREPIEQLAAIKVIKPGMDTHETLRRFDTERRALAMMSHPCIARVYDAGATSSGRPYVVMEYVEGDPLTVFARERGLSIKQRIELMIDVCEAVQHAHSKGVIHRDLKPTNILVVNSSASESGVARAGVSAAHPIPKIIDFGVAKVIDEMLLLPTTGTGAARQAGTPRYMSPEQLEPGNRGVDTRTDVYSLGVTLYELLTGLTPQRDDHPEPTARLPAHAGVDADAPRPEPRLRRTRHGERAAESDPTGAMYLALPGWYRADLHRIFQCAMSVSPDARYATPIHLADDLRAVLTGRPIHAARMSWGYRASKFVRRNRGASVMAVLTAGLVLGGAVASVSVARRERALRQAADGASDAASLASDRSRLAAALALLSSGDAAAAKSNLHRISPEARGWEWRVLAGEIDPVERVFRGHTAQISSARFSHDGSMIVSGSYDGSARLWDTRTGRQLYEWRGDFGSDRVCADFSPDGTTVVVGGHAEALWFFDARSKEEIRRVVGVCLNDLRWSPDGSLIAIAARSGPAILVEPITGAVLRTLDFPAEELHFSADGSLLAMTGNNGSRLSHVGALFEVGTGRRLWERAIGQQRATAIAVSPDAKLVALCSGDHGVLSRPDSSAEIQVISGDAIRGMCFAGAEGPLVGGSDSGALYAWQPKASSRPTRRLAPTHSLWVRDVTRSRDKVVTTSGDHWLRLWAVNDSRQWSTAPIHGAEHFTVVASAYDNRVAAFSYRSNRILLKDIGSDRADRVVDVPLRGLESVAFIPESDALLVAGEGMVGRLDLTTLSISRLFPVIDSWVQLELSPDRTTLAASCLGQPTMLHDLTTGETHPLLCDGSPRPVRGCAFSPDSRVLACIDDVGFRLTLVEWRSGRVLHELRGHTDWIFDAAFSPDGRNLASGSSDGSLRVWDAQKGAPVATLKGVGHVSGPRFVDDGRRLLAGDRGGFLRVWDTKDWEEVCSFRAHPSWAAACVTADGQQVITSGHADGLRIWSAAH